MGRGRVLRMRERRRSGSVKCAASRGAAVRSDGSGSIRSRRHLSPMEDAHRRPHTSGFRHLRVWQEAIRLAAATQPVCGELERSRRAHLASQLARAATSVHANIAEGNGRGGPRDRARVLTIAWGSLLEVEPLLAEAGSDRAIAHLLAPCEAHARHTGRLLAALRRTLRP
ncbi:MAG: four helix bundle protein [Gemmatirosa sp.]